MSGKTDLSKGPGVYVPPPFLYVAIFIVSESLQRKWPIAPGFFDGLACKAAAVAALILAAFFLARSLRQFLRTKNTVVPIKPATSLQTDGIYRFSRNPMYVGLALVYLGAMGFAGNAWTLILFPVLLLLIQELIIKREERYLALEFGEQYAEYKKKTRRWV